MADRKNACYCMYFIGAGIVLASWVGVVSHGIGWLGWLVGMIGWAAWPRGRF